jgi:hypothetical protein
VLWLTVVVAISACQGCGGNSQAKLSLDLKRTGLAYISFHDDKDKKGPANWDELIDYAGKANLFPESIKRVRDAGYTMTWNVKLSEVTQPTSNVILAKPASAGPTLMLDGSVRE